MYVLIYILKMMFNMYHFGCMTFLLSKSMMLIQAVDGVVSLSQLMNVLIIIFMETFL